MAGEKPTLRVQGQVRIVDRRDAARAGVPFQDARPAFHPVEVNTIDLWVCVPLPPAWRAEYRLAIQDQHLVVAELRVFPCAPDAPNETWAGDLTGLHSRVPPGGLSATILKRVRIGADIAAGRHILRWLDSQARQKGQQSAVVEGLRTKSLADFGRPKPQAGSPESGRRGLPRSVYVKVARAYQQAIAAGSRRPVVDTAAALVGRKATRQELAQTSQRIFRARRLGLLTRTSQGRAGGLVVTT